MPDDHLVGERVLGVVLGGDRGDDALREVADRLGQLLVVVGQRAGGQKVSHELRLSSSLHGDPGQRLAHLDLVADGDE